VRRKGVAFDGWYSRTKVSYNDLPFGFLDY